MFNHSVILAAGTGERMRPLTHYCPKPLIRVDCKPLIHHVLGALPYNSQKHITVGHLSKLVLDDTYLEADSFINTTGKSNSWFLFNSLIRNIDDFVICCPCDIIFKIDWEQLYKEAADLNTACGIVPVPRISGIEADFIHSVDRKCVKISRDNPSPIYASGIQILNPRKINELLHRQRRLSFYGVWSGLINLNQLSVFTTQPSQWKAIDRLDQI
jgi:NDP-sugar pyrophosphorylase family protein